MMRNIFRFAMMDFRTINIYTKNLLLMPLLGIVLTIVLRSVNMLNTYLIVIAMMMTSYPFAIAEASRLNILYSTLPIMRRDVVAGRYLYALLSGLAVFALGAVASALLVLLMPGLGEVEGPAFNMVMLGVYVLVVSMQYPLYFGMDYTKSKSVAYLPMMVVFLGVTLLPTLNETMNLGIDNLEALLSGNAFSTPLAAGGIAVVILVVALASAWLSCILYSRRDL